MKSKIVTYDSDFYHNGHSDQRDRLLIELYGEKWLKEQKSLGYYGGDWPDSIIGTKKDLYEPLDHAYTEIVKLKSIDELPNKLT